MKHRNNKKHKRSNISGRAVPVYTLLQVDVKMYPNFSQIIWNIDWNTGEYVIIMWEGTEGSTEEVALHKLSRGAAHEASF